MPKVRCGKSSRSRSQDLNFNAIYTVPGASFIPTKSRLHWAVERLADRLVCELPERPVPGASGQPTLNFLQSEDIRVPGQPLYTPGVNINDHSTFNPLHHSGAESRTPGRPAQPVRSVRQPRFYYKDFRGPRTPTEDASIGRNFRFGPEGKFNLFIRAEFVNIFNRTLFPNPSTANPGRIGQSVSMAAMRSVNRRIWRHQRLPARPAAYYGTAPYLQGRTGTLIARFSF